MSNGLDRWAIGPGFEESFETVVVPHLDAGYRLARWLMRDEHDAEDVVQEASLRAFRYFRTFVGGDARAWFLKIVRNTCYGWRRHGYQPATDSFDEEQHSNTRPQSDPETRLPMPALLRTPIQRPLRLHLPDNSAVYQVISDHFSHWAHHRGQLTVYLRLLEIPQPCIYGPTADEGQF